MILTHKKIIFQTFSLPIIAVYANFVDMKKKILYLINPISGTQRKQGIEKLALEHTDKNVFDVNIAYTEYAGHATLLAKDAVERGYNVVVAVGGDGTVNEVGRALVHTDTALAIIPCGSGNGLARHLRIPRSPLKAVEIINQCVVHRLDYGTINDKPFFCTCGVGFDAFISEKFAAAGKRGPITYIENTLKSGLKYKPQTYTIENESGTESCKAFLIACANASQYGNDAYIAPFASMKDGLLDVVVMKPFNTFEAPQVTLQLFTRTLPDNSHVSTFKAQKLIIHREEEGVAHYDGDPFWTGKTIEVGIQHKALNVVVNPTKDKSMPQNQAMSLLQRIPNFLNEWKAMPEELINKTGEDLKRLNKNLIDKIKRNI